MECAPRETACTVGDIPVLDDGVPHPLAATLSDFSIFRRVVNGCLILRVTGELDLATVPLLDRALHATSEHVTIDARDLTFIDAHGIGALIAAHARTGVSVRHARPSCRRVFALCALGHLLDDGRPRS